MKCMYCSIKYRYSDILLKKHKLHLNRLFCCNHICYCVIMVSVTSASRYITSASCYHPRYQSRSSMYFRGFIPQISRNWPRQFRLSMGLLYTNHVDFSIQMLKVKEFCQKRKEGTATEQRRLLSSDSTFDFRIDCFFCDKTIESKPFS